MQVNINIDDTQMSKIINDGINARDAETVTNIARQSLCKAFEDPEIAQTILFEKRGIYGFTEIRPWVSAAISKSLTEADYEKFKDLVFAAIGEHAKDIIVETLAKTLANNLFHYENKDNFMVQIMQAVKRQNS